MVEEEEGERIVRVQEAGGRRRRRREIKSSCSIRGFRLPYVGGRGEYAISTGVNSKRWQQNTRSCRTQKMSCYLVDRDIRFKYHLNKISYEVKNEQESWGKEREKGREEGVL